MEEHNRNPWFSIWTHPRSAIRMIVNTNPNRSIYLLSTIYILQTLLFSANHNSLGLYYPFAAILIAALVLSPIIGVIWLNLAGGLLYLAGKCLKGAAPFKHIRSALAWSGTPMLINLIMWFILLILSTDYAFIQFSKGIPSFFIYFISLVASIWCFVILIQNIREVQDFSIARAISTWVLYMIGGLIVFFVLSYLIFTIAYNN